uniref:Uncharacterized protein n=1 Tax=Anguilla anguilla TaxID=7936 RepID=A0A0E9VPC4_ANGAN
MLILSKIGDLLLI